MADESEGRAQGAASPGGWWFAAAEILAITLLFAATGAWPVPDVNETVYLPKARHAADASYGRGDFFLETPDAHGVFYLLMGPLAAAVPLETAAWLGRIAGWLALAIGFRHLALPLLTAPAAAGAWARLAAAALFALALRHTQAAGEWVIGGCEAKVFAWALVFGGVGEVVRGRWSGAACLLGAATACHPIVGGWAMVAATLAHPVGPRASHRPRNPRDAILVVIGVALAAAGVVPALQLSGGADPVTRAEAARIYVVERLPHHLLPRAFATGFVPRHVLAILAWWLLDRLAAPSPARASLTRFTLAALGISLAGFVIAVLEPWAATAVYGLLRYYWFRLADVAVPLALAFAAVAVLVDDATCRRLVPLSPRTLRGLVTLLLAAALALESRHWPLPGRTLAPRSDAKVDAAAWADICTWARDHLPPGTCAVTPRGAASFTWRTGIPEVVSWKNSPQDAASLVEWRRRIADCFSADGTLGDMGRSTAALGEQRLREVADRYGATVAIVPRDSPRLADLPFERLHANERYVVLRLTD